MLRFFTGPSRLIEIPVGCASPQALHRAKISYLGTMVPCRDALPALPLCFSEFEMSRSIVVSSQSWTTAYTRPGLKIKRPLSLFNRSHDRRPTAWQLQPVLLRLLSCFETSTGDPFNLDNRAELTGNTGRCLTTWSWSCIGGLGTSAAEEKTRDRSEEEKDGVLEED
jgi:hypothetical protein